MNLFCCSAILTDLSSKHTIQRRGILEPNIIVLILHYSTKK